MGIEEDLVEAASDNNTNKVNQLLDQWGSELRDLNGTEVCFSLGYAKGLALVRATVRGHIDVVNAILDKCTNQPPHDMPETATYALAFDYTDCFAAIVQKGGIELLDDYMLGKLFENFPTLQASTILKEAVLRCSEEDLADKRQRRGYQSLDTFLRDAYALESFNKAFPISRRPKSLHRTGAFDDRINTFLQIINEAPKPLDSILKKEVSSRLGIDESKLELYESQKRAPGSVIDIDQAIEDIKKGKEGGTNSKRMDNIQVIQNAIESLYPDKKQSSEHEEDKVKRLLADTIIHFNREKQKIGDLKTTLAEYNPLRKYENSSGYSVGLTDLSNETVASIANSLFPGEDADSLNGAKVLGAFTEAAVSKRRLERHLGGSAAPAV